MEELSVLCAALKVHFNPWNLARIKCLSQLVRALILTKTINLSQMSEVFQGKSKQGSHYKRICRFMSDFDLPFDSVARFVVSVFPFPDKWHVAIDRTNWKFGQSSINVLSLAMCYKGTAIPLLWKTLDRKANSTTPERIELMDRFLKLFGEKKIFSLLADREFV